MLVVVRVGCFMGEKCFMVVVVVVALSLMIILGKTQLQYAQEIRGEHNEGV